MTVVGRAIAATTIVRLDLRSAARFGRIAKEKTDHTRKAHRILLQHPRAACPWRITSPTSTAMLTKERAIRLTNEGCLVTQGGGGGGGREGRLGA